ncbi:hypothetical protein IAR55_003122 [Kwoniella newhampshirensis]|uniref:Uncharacterized protein n=1 Tax=Kwoniella newhampshirensis TaxID=1651941 RepID=A0AAW0Z0K8_9TREE
MSHNAPDGAEGFPHTQTRGRQTPDVIRPVVSDLFDRALTDQPSSATEQIVGWMDTSDQIREAVSTSARMTPYMYVPSIATNDPSPHADQSAGYLSTSGSPSGGQSFYFRSEDGEKYGPSVVHSQKGFHNHTTETPFGRLFSSSISPSASSNDFNKPEVIPHYANPAFLTVPGTMEHNGGLPTASSETNPNPNRGPQSSYSDPSLSPSPAMDTTAIRDDFSKNNEVTRILESVRKDIPGLVRRLFKSQTGPRQDENTVITSSIPFQGGWHAPQDTAPVFSDTGEYRRAARWWLSLYDQEVTESVAERCYVGRSSSKVGGRVYLQARGYSLHKETRGAMRNIADHVFQRLRSMSDSGALTLKVLRDSTPPDYVKQCALDYMFHAAGRSDGRLVWSYKGSGRSEASRRGWIGLRERKREALERSMEKSHRTENMDEIDSETK